VVGGAGVRHGIGHGIKEMRLRFQISEKTMREGEGAEGQIGKKEMKLEKEKWKKSQLLINMRMILFCLRWERHAEVSNLAPTNKNWRF